MSSPAQMPLVQSALRLQLHVIPWHPLGASGLLPTPLSLASPTGASPEGGESTIAKPDASGDESAAGRDVASASSEASWTVTSTVAHLRVCASHRMPAAHPAPTPGVHVSLRATHWRVLGTQTQSVGQLSAAPGRQVKEGIASPTMSSHPPPASSARTAVAAAATATPPTSRSALRTLSI